jgi:hypothetical protein
MMLLIGKGGQPGKLEAESWGALYKLQMDRILEMSRWLAQPAAAKAQLKQPAIWIHANFTTHHANGCLAFKHNILTVSKHLRRSTGWMELR